MTDLSSLSDAELEALYQRTPDVPAMVASAAVKHGVDPVLALNVARQESGFRPDAVSPKGAVGPMQLMPGTAADLGVDPHDVAQNIDGGVRLLKQHLDAFGDPTLALAAYNAGPAAVREHGGVPPYPETQKYVEAVTAGSGDLSKLSDDELRALYGATAPQGQPQSPAAAKPAAPVVVMNPETGKPYNDAQQSAYAALIRAGKLDPHAAPGSAMFPRGLVDEHDTPDPGTWYVDMAGNLKQAPGVDYVAEAKEGALAPWQRIAQDVSQAVQKSDARLAAGAPKSLADFGRRMVDFDFGGIPTVARDIVGAIPGSVIGAVTRPAAAFIADKGPQFYRPPQLTFQNGRVGFTDAVPLHGRDAVDYLQSKLNEALSAVRPAAPRPPAPTPMSMDELRAAKDAAYGAVDASGFKLPQKDVQTLADNMAQQIRDLGGPEGAKLLPGSDVMQKRLDALAKQPGGVPLTQLDKLRSDLYDVLVKPGGPDSIVGNQTRSAIDSLINASGAPDIATARDLNTRLMKSQAINDRLDSAGLRSGSTYSGGNYTNAVRQSLRPLVDPTSGAQIRNLTPDETAALREIIKGTTAQNMTRYASKLLTNKLVQVPAGVLTKGAGPAVMEGVGTVLNKAGQAQTNAAVQRLLDLISSGGTAPSPPPFPTLSLAGRPAIPLMSPRGVIGAAAIAQSARQKQSASR